MVWRFNTNLEQMVMAKVEAELKSWVSISVQEQKQSNQSRELTQLPAESVTESVSLESEDCCLVTDGNMYNSLGETLRVGGRRSAQCSRT